MTETDKGRTPIFETSGRGPGDHKVYRDPGPFTRRRKGPTSSSGGGNDREGRESGVGSVVGQKVQVGEEREWWCLGTTRAKLPVE